MKGKMTLGLPLLLVGLLAACEQSSSYDKKPAHEGNVAVVAHEGRLVGRGYMQVDGHTVAVKMGRITVDGKDYGAVTDGAEIYYRSNGDFHQLLVNGEERHPTKKKK